MGGYSTWCKCWRTDIALQHVLNRSFLSSLVPLFQSEENDFDMHENETACRTLFLMKGFAFRLVLKQRHKRTRKWPESRYRMWLHINYCSFSMVSTLFVQHLWCTWVQMFDMWHVLFSVWLQQPLVLIHSLWCVTVLETLRMRPSVKEQPGSSASQEPLWVVISVMM